MRIFLIRHAQTQGNLERRYIGSTDEPLAPAGAACFCNRAYPTADAVYVSPMRRCRQTAQIIYPAICPRVEDDLRECDFGVFEGKRYDELCTLSAYRGWIDSAGTAAPPEGEAAADFKNRCCDAFVRCVDEAFAQGLHSAAFVVHGGTIMAVLERFAVPRRAFYDWQIGNAGGWEASVQPESWREEHLLTVQKQIDCGGS